MQRYIFGTFLFLLHRTIYIDGISTLTYEVLAGIRVANPYRTIPFSRNSRSMCAAYCISEKTTCNSANYNDVTKTCELNIQSLLAESALVVEDSDWIVLYIPDDTWELVFRGSAGIGVMIHPTYIGTISPATPEVGCHLTHTLTCTTHYRSAIIDNWDTQNIKQVKVAMYKNSTLVINLIFDNQSNDTNVSWFSKDRLASSSFTDLTLPNQTFNFFSIDGDASVVRRFYINKSYDGCSDDYGWMVIYEAGPRCDYENEMEYPYFAYMPNNIFERWEKGVFQSADVFAIFVRKG